MSTTISGTSGVTFPDSTSMQTGQQACKAWVNFNGTGTVAIRAGYNVSSITDNGTGNYTVNFTNAMPDANYVVSGSANDDAAPSSYVWLGTGAGIFSNILRTTSAINVQAIFTTSDVADASTVNVAIFSN